MLEERQQSILKAVILEHFKTARPVASRELTDDSSLSLSSATIRNEMLALDNLGYLEQPHTSAGRTPTDKGYRFFVDYLLSEAPLRPEEERRIERVYDIGDEEEFIKEFSRAISALSGTFAAAGTLENDFFYESGFSRIINEPELHEAESARAFGRLIDFLDEEVKHIFEKFNLEEKIFIGKENPLKEARKCAMIISPWKHPRGFKGFFTLIGPRRTDYSRHMAIIQEIKKYYE